MRSLALLPCLFLLAPVKGQDAAKPTVDVLQPFVEKGHLAGAVTLVADKEKVLAHEMVGFAHVADKRPMAKDSLFWIASMTKPMTGAGLMILVDEGRVNLDDPVAKYLPEMKDLWVAAEADKEHMLLKRPKSPVTVRMLMTHTSGMPFTGPLEPPGLDRLPLSDATRGYALTPLTFEPGTKFVYSNCGINAAGRIIEVVSKMPYEKFMSERLFTPLGMSDTTFTPTAEQVKRLATSYKPNAGKDKIEETIIWALTYPLTAPARQPMPGGGLFSTAADVTAFCQMVLNGGEWNGKRILSEKAVAEMVKRSTPAGLPAWGIGWALAGDGYGHGGAFATQMAINPKRGLITVFLVQHNGFPADGARSYGVWKAAAEAKYAK
jgi:CubicO group peptidase (beta-lactamase class C family)